jgi:hypothetical protein
MVGYTVGLDQNNHKQNSIYFQTFSEATPILLIFHLSWCMYCFEYLREFEAEFENSWACESGVHMGPIVFLKK